MTDAGSDNGPTRLRNEQDHENAFEVTEETFVDGASTCFKRVLSFEPVLNWRRSLRLLINDDEHYEDGDEGDSNNMFEDNHE